MRIFKFFAAFVVLMMFQLASSSEIILSVSEPGISERVREGFSCGIPFKKGTISSVNQLSAFDGTTEIPAQFDVLTKHEDGSIMWVLTSIKTDLGRNAKKEFKVSTQPSTVVPSTPITISRTGSIIEINNGVLRFKIDTVNFTGIDSLYYNGVPYIGGKTGGLFLDNKKDSTIYKNGTVTKSQVVYGGALRATIKIDGQFFKKSVGGIGYSYVVTTYAGSPKLTIDATIRNSISEKSGDVARVRRASINFPVLFTPSTETSYKFNVSQYAKPEIKDFSTTGKNITIQEEWNGGVYGYVEIGTGSNFMFHNVFSENGMVGADIIVARPTDVPSPAKSRGYETGDFYWLCDGICKSSQIILNFGTAGKSTTDLSSEFTLNKSPLMGRPDPKWVGETGLLGIYGQFGSIDDEVATWQKFGKTVTGVAKPFLGRDLQFSKSVCLGTLHYDIEDDPTEQWLFQWLRTDSRGFMDRTQGWARFMKTNMTYHTTGFTYDGYSHNTSKIRNLSTRTIVYEADDAQVAKSRYSSTVDFSTWGTCHTIGWGLISWYCLTGDIEARDAADDLAELTWPASWYYASLLPGAPQNPNGTFTRPFFTGKGRVSVTRSVTRPYHFIMNYYSRLKMGDPVWKNRVDLASEMFMNIWNKDPRGFFFDFSPMRTTSGDTSYYYLSGTRKSWAGWPEKLRQFIADSQITFTLTNLPGNKFEGNSHSDKMVLASRPLENGDTLKWVQKGESTPWSAGLYSYNPLSEYFRLTGNEDARDLILGCAQAMVLSPLIINRCGFSHNGNIVDYPAIGRAECLYGHSDLSGGDAVNPVGFDNLNAEHDKCVGGWGTAEHSCAVHDGAYIVQLPQVMSMAYGFTGDGRFIDKAMTSWNRGLKRAFYSTNYSSPENVIAYGSVTGENNGDNRFIGGLNFFHQVVTHTDTIKPSNVNDLDVAPAIDQQGKIYVTFSIPEVNSGSLTEYQLKYDRVPVVAYEDFDYARDYKFPAVGVKKSPFWYAKNISDEPKPSGNSGSLAMFAIDNSIMNGLGTDTLYFALCTRNSAGNMSAISNSAKIWATKQGISVEKGVGASVVNHLSVSPNPFNPTTNIKYRYMGGSNVSLKIFNASGRVVSNLTRSVMGGKAGVQQHGTIQWNGCDDNGKTLSSGLYIMKLAVDSKTMIKKISLLK